MTLEHLAFPKIATRIERSAGDDWVASEKIHGAQLVIGVDASRVMIGKRKAWLAPGESFFGWQLLRLGLESAGRAIHGALATRGTLYLYGELFGGRYPHPDVAPVAGLVPVQTGIWYAPDLRYSLFDIVLVEDGVATFLAHDRVRALAADAGLHAAPVLGRGRLTDLQRLPVRYPSRVARELGLPAIEPNVAEGFVLKPATAAPFESRPCAKYKIPEFDEQRFDGANAFDENAHLSQDALFEIAARLVNASRLASAQSKVGADPAAVSEEAALDALVDLHDMFPRHMAGLAPSDESALNQHLARIARAKLQEIR